MNFRLRAENAIGEGRRLKSRRETDATGTERASPFALPAKLRQENAQCFGWFPLRMRYAVPTLRNAEIR